MVALVFGVAFQGAIALVGLLFGGYFGTPIPDGESSGITFSLLGGYYGFSLLLFAVNLVLTAAAFYVVIRRLPVGRLGVLVSLVVFAILVACGPLVLIAFGNQVNWWAVAVDAILVAVAAWLIGVVNRDRPWWEDR